MLLCHLENPQWFLNWWPGSFLACIFLHMDLMCNAVHCQLLCKPGCCRESFNAVQGTVYLGHGWFVPPHWNASKGLWKWGWYLVGGGGGFLSLTLSDWNVLGSVGSNAVSCSSCNLQVLQGQNTHLPLRRTEHSSSLVLRSNKHNWL